MKKFLLSVMSLMLLAVGANAQNLNNVVKAEVSADPVSYTHLTLPTNREV